MNLSWETILEYLKTFGLLRGLFVLFFFFAHFWIYREYKGRLADRQGEIDRIAQDNREYRERFMELLDKHFGLDGDTSPPQLPEPPEEGPPRGAAKGAGATPDGGKKKGGKK